MERRLISFCSFRPDEDQGNPGRNVVFQDGNCAGAEGEEIVIWLPSKREHMHAYLKVMIQLRLEKTCSV